MGICLQNEYADVLQKNGYIYQGADGQTYNSGAYSIVHDKDFVGNKWLPFVLGTNDTTKGNCGFFCYSHSSYFAEVPKEGTEERKEYERIWGKVEYDENGKEKNKSQPILVKPHNVKDSEKYEEKNPF